MRIFLDLEKLRDPYSGLGQFCAHLGRALVETRPPDSDLTAYLPEKYIGFLGHDVRYQIAGKRPGYPAEKSPFDIWHNTHQDARYWPSSRATRTVLTIHDLNFLERSDYGALKKRFKLWQQQRLIDRADALVAISAFTAGQVRQHLSIGNKPLHVILNGCPPLVSENKQTLISGLAQPFVLALGVVHPKKNWHVLLPLIQRFPERQLVIAGSDTHPYGSHLRQEIINLGLERQVHLMGPVTEAQKAWLLRNCEALWFPSLSEGFGIPPIEAMRVGKPVFLSNLTSLPEVGGAEAYYWDSFAPDVMAEVFVKGMADFRRDPAKAEILHRRATLFSWEKAAIAYWEIYKDILQKT